MLGGNLRKGSSNRRLRTKKSKSILLPSTAQETLELFEQNKFGVEKQKELVPSHPSLIFFVKWI